MRRRVLVLAALLTNLPAPAPAQQADVLNSGRRPLTAERMHDGERIDARRRARRAGLGARASAGEFIMQDPMLGGTPTEPPKSASSSTRITSTWASRCHDSEPDRLLGNTRKRDEFLSADDRFMWTMDTFLNQQTGYFFEMNPSGLMADALMGPGGTNNREWDGIWNARVRRSEIGWTIEIDIPFRTLAFDPNAPAWGVNFQRTVRRKNEETVWTGHLRNQGLRRMSNAGLLLGTERRDAGPWARSEALRRRRRSPTRPGACPAMPRDTEADVGGEVTYNVTPSLRGGRARSTPTSPRPRSITRQVNLTRFPLFFPEKRGFFLDGATFFDFSRRTRRSSRGASASTPTASRSASTSAAS